MTTPKPQTTHDALLHLDGLKIALDIATQYDGTDLALSAMSEILANAIEVIRRNTAPKDPEDLKKQAQLYARSRFLNTKAQALGMLSTLRQIVETDNGLDLEEVDFGDVDNMVRIVHDLEDMIDIFGCENEA